MGESAEAGADRAAVARVRDLLGTGYISAECAQAVVAAAPAARDHILSWLRDFARAGEWRSFEKFSNLAVHTHPEGLAAVLIPVIVEGTARTNYEDLVEILGEVATDDGEPDAVPALHRLLTARLTTEGPGYWLCLKTVEALGAIGGPRAEEILHAVAVGDYPKPVKWQAAVELAIEDELGFDEGEMTGSP